MSTTRTLALSTAAALALGTLAGTLTGISPASAQQPKPVSRTAPPVTPKGALVTDGTVDSMTAHGDSIVVTGDFSHLGTYTGSALAYRAGTVKPAALATLNGDISAVEPDGKGGWYVGGTLDAGKGQSITHVLPSGKVDPNFAVTVSGYVYDLALGDHGLLYLGGQFSYVGNKPRHNLAAISVATGKTAAFHHDVPRAVPEIAYAPATAVNVARVYASSKTLLALDPTTGAPVPGFQAAVAPRRKYEIAPLGDRVFVGGGGVVALDAGTGAVDEPFVTDGLKPSPAKGFDDTVSTLVIKGHTLYVGGDFRSINGVAGPLAAFDTETGAPITSFEPTVTGLGDPKENRGVFDVAVVGKKLWVAGKFTGVDGKPADNLAVVDATTGALRRSPAPDVNAPANVLDASHGKVFVGGAFTLTDLIRANGFARVDARTLVPVTGRRAKVMPRTRFSYGLLDSAKALYTSVYERNGTQTQVALNPDNGTVIERLTQRGLRDVSAVTTDQRHLYVVTDADLKHTFGANRMTVYSTLTGKREASYLLPYPGYVLNLRAQGDSVLVAGSFKRTRPNGQKANLAIMKVRTSDGAFDEGFDPHLNGPVESLTQSGSPLVVSGYFKYSNIHHVGEHVHRGIAALDATTGSASARFHGSIDPYAGYYANLSGFGHSVLLGNLFNTGNFGILDATTGKRRGDLTGYGRSATNVFEVGGRQVVRASTYQPFGYGFYGVDFLVPMKKK